VAAWLLEEALDRSYSGTTKLNRLENLELSTSIRCRVSAIENASAQIKLEARYPNSQTGWAANGTESNNVKNNRRWNASWRLQRRFAD
jgi:hypothetical protein